MYYAKYHKGDNYVVLKIAPELKPYLLALSNNFLKYNIVNILPLKSAYVIRLYELCKDYYAEGTRYKPKTSVLFDMKIDRLRELFNIPDSYKYNDIRRHIIDKSVKQFKEKTDIQISYTEIKLGRKVHSLHITVKENNKGSNDYLSSKKVFVAWVREKYKPNVEKEIYPIILVTNKGKIRVDINGKLYLSDNSKNGNATEYDHSQANKVWTWLYDGVKDETLKLNTL
ncbi:MAG: replication initiation protein [Sulfurovum sp.]|nr:replication initiation protein [Sulfurovum sp.]